jgi:hypothetical protein
MQETKRMAEDANRMGEEIQERAQRMGREYQKAAESGFEAASQSFREVNRGFQAMAAELTDFSKRTWEDGIQAWEQLLHVRHFGDVVEVQTRYAQRAYDAYMSEISKVGEIYLGAARNASKPGEEPSKGVR